MPRRICPLAYWLNGTLGYSLRCASWNYLLTGSPILELHGQAKRTLDWFNNNSELIRPYVLAESEPPLDWRLELATEALRSAVRKDEILEDHEIIGRDISDTRLAALKSDIHTVAFSGNSVERVFKEAGAILNVSGDAKDAPEERGFAQLVPKGFLTDTPDTREDATTDYHTLDGRSWGQDLSDDVHRRFCEVLEGAPEISSPLQTPDEFLRAVDRSMEELNGSGRVAVLLAGDWFSLQVALNTGDFKGYEVDWRLPQSERVGEIGRYRGHPILSIPDYEDRCLYVVEIAAWGQFLRAQFEAGQDLRIDVNTISADRAHELLAINPDHFPGEPDEESKLRKLQTHVEIVIGARTGFHLTDPSRAMRIVPITQEDGD